MDNKKLLAQISTPEHLEMMFNMGQHPKEIKVSKLQTVLTEKGLTTREQGIADLVSRGLSNKEVANQFFIMEKTVKFHLTNIYKKMGVKSRAQLIVFCLPYMGFNEPIGSNQDNS